MKLKNLLYAAVGSAALAFSTASCSDYLDISGEFNASLGIDEVWSNASYTRNWYGVIYRHLMEYSETGSEVSAFKNPWSNLCGEIASEKASSRDVMMQLHGRQWKLSSLGQFLQRRTPSHDFH